MSLRKGITKSTLESSTEAALLAVEIYNKPRTPFRVEGFITQMIIAWTRLLHAHFHQTIGSKYYYKNANGHYQTVDGEKKSWELKTCISKFGKFDESIKSNLLFFIRLRNKIEHRHVSREEVGAIIFGECQALLYNFENTLIEFFGEEYAINESLAFSLQFSRQRKNSQIEASKKLLSKEVRDLKSFIENYRMSLSDEVFNTQEYSIKLIQIPKISNTSKNDLAIEFVNWDSLSKTDKDNYKKLDAIIKDKVIKKEAINPGKLKAQLVLDKVNAATSIELNHYDHKCLYNCCEIRPPNNKVEDPFNTNTKYCHYDEVHQDYIYQEAWVKTLIHGIESGFLTRKEWKINYKAKKKISLELLKIF